MIPSETKSKFHCIPYTQLKRIFGKTACQIAILTFLPTPMIYFTTWIANYLSLIQIPHFY